VASTPDHLTLKEHRDDDLRVELVARRLVLCVLTVLALLALANVFGQNPAHSIGTGEAATLEVSAPSRLRGGLFYEGEFTIRARQEIESATLLLDSGWFESMHINSYSPEPVGSAYRNGMLALDYGHVAEGDTLVARLEFQVNATNVGHRSQSVQLHDEDVPLAAIERSVTIFP
jgi:hypothetical protein